MTAGDEFSFFAGKGRVVYHEVHCNGRLGNFLERDCVGRIGRAERVSDVQVCNTGNCNDGADTRLADFYFIQTVKLVKLADLYALGGVGIVMVDDDNLLIDGNLAIIHFADADSADVFVVINGTDQQLQTSIRVALVSRDVVQDRVEQRLHILILNGQVRRRTAVFRGCVNKGAIQLLVSSIQL